MYAWLILKEINIHILLNGSKKIIKVNNMDKYFFNAYSVLAFAFCKRVAKIIPLCITPSYFIKIKKWLRVLQAIPKTSKSFINSLRERC